MELWIRSQGKKFLLKVDDLSIRENHTKLDEYAICFKDNFLGFYNTEQRCIEILDEIQRLIVNSNKTILTTSSDLDQRTYDDILEEVEKNNFTILSCVNTPQIFPLNQNIVYQMPEK